MNNKGFTLVELLATVVILAIITSVAVVSVTRVSSAIRTKQRENTIIRIENAASKYAFDTGETIVFVETLIEAGYLNSDNDEGNIIDPLNNTILNCYAVKMQKSGSYYVATFIDDNSYGNSSSCDSEKLYRDYAGVEINVLKNSVKVNANTWLNGNLTLSAHSNSLTIDCTNQNNCIWTSTMGAEEKGSSINIVNNNLEQIVTYHFTYKTTVDGNTKNYTNSVNLKLDNKAPEITSFVDSGSSTATLIVTEQGSGVIEVCINDNSNLTNDCEWESVSGNNFTTTKKVTATGDYYAHVKDAVGNIGHSTAARIIYHG